MKKLMTMIALLFVGASFGQVSFGDVTGKVLKKGTNEPIDYARVFILDNGQAYNSRTDMDGKFKISAVPSGTFQLLILKDLDTMRVGEVKVLTEAIADVGTIFYTNNVLEMKGVIVSANGDGLKLIKGFLPIPRLEAEEIARSPNKFSISTMVSSMTTDVKKTDDGSLVFRGARKGDMIYYVDGMKIVGDQLNLPSTAIGNMMVYSGGLPAQFGDTMGGVVAIETKGYFDLLRQYESAQLRKNK